MFSVVCFLILQFYATRTAVSRGDGLRLISLCSPSPVAQWSLPRCHIPLRDIVCQAKTLLQSVCRSNGVTGNTSPFLCHLAAAECLSEIVSSVSQSDIVLVDAIDTYIDQVHDHQPCCMFAMATANFTQPETLLGIPVMKPNGIDFSSLLFQMPAELVGTTGAGCFGQLHPGGLCTSGADPAACGHDWGLMSYWCLHSQDQCCAGALHHVCWPTYHCKPLSLACVMSRAPMRAARCIAGQRRAVWAG